MTDLQTAQALADTFTEQDIRDYSGRLPDAPCSAVWQVVCEHNRYGEWIAGTYTNEEAARWHKQWSDGRLDGWENITPAEVRRVDVMERFSPPN